MWWNPAVLSEVRAAASSSRACHVVVPRSSSPTTRRCLRSTSRSAHRRRRGRLELHPEPVLQHAINNQFAFGWAFNRAVRQQTEYSDGWMGRYRACCRRSSRSTSTRRFREGHARVSVGAGVKLPVHRRRVHQQRQLLGGDGLRGRGRGRAGRFPRALVAADLGATAGLTARQDHGTTPPGAGTSCAAWT